MALLMAVCVGMASAAAPEPDYRHHLQQMHMAEDDPGQVLRAAEQRLRAPAQSNVQRFWDLLSAAYMHQLLSEPQASQPQLTQARELLDRLSPDARKALEPWLMVMESSSAHWYGLIKQAAQTRLALTQRAATIPGGSELRCISLSLELSELYGAEHDDEVWRVAEHQERCGRELKLDFLRSGALAMLAQVRILSSTGAADVARGMALMEQALAVSRGNEPGGGRYRRSVIHYEAASALLYVNRVQEALVQLDLAMALSQELHDVNGVAAANMLRADALILSKDYLQARQLLDEAYALLDKSQSDPRLHALVISQVDLHTLAQLPALPVWLARGQALLSQQQTPSQRQALLSVLARGHASLKQWQKAYDYLQDSFNFFDKARQVKRDVELLRLQSRYTSALQEAENAELRHKAEAQALALQAHKARDRLMWAALTVLASLAILASMLALRAHRRRRLLQDLALRDPLTDAPNRRAVSAYAQSQITQARRLGLPLAIALIDLDHFKQVNDQHGHAGGDALLQLFATSCTTILRGQDRVGRWGGEEWLIVTPGSTRAELHAIFSRLQRHYAKATSPLLPSPHEQTFSMGGAELGLDGESLDDLLERADERLYQAKTQGRNRLV
ncbi:diguanylate cyclase [Roseateles sp. BYS180W]|uniref:diguanylate cyclase n=1 Tax=Roseateles rivi TaxID=3299028 RepID=A0ABW7FTR3_9BURK